MDVSVCSELFYVPDPVRWSLNHICVWHFCKEEMNSSIPHYREADGKFSMWSPFFFHHCIKSVSAVFSNQSWCGSSAWYCTDPSRSYEGMNGRSCAFFLYTRAESCSGLREFDIVEYIDLKKKSTRSFLWWFGTVGDHYYVLVVLSYVVCYVFQLFACFPI